MNNKLDVNIEKSDRLVIITILNMTFTNDKVIIDKNYNLTMQVRYFLAKDWDIQVIHVYKKTNSAAN
jgi:hypothetical protein